MKVTLISTALLFVGLIAQTGLANTSINTDNAYSFGANIGWVNLRGNETDGTSLGLFYSEGYAWSPNVGWISLGSGTPANGWSYANDSDSDWGVNHDGEGNLTGYAYGANIGWINFGHGQTEYEPQVDLQTGVLSGYVWGANVGWISLSNSMAYAQTEYLDPGPDGTVASVPAAWEAMKGDDLDGMSDEEIRRYYHWGSDPTLPTGARFSAIERDTSTEIALSWDTVQSRQYQLQTTTNLMDATTWEDAGLGIMQGVDGEITQSIPYDQSVKRFFRVRPVVPLSDR